MEFIDLKSQQALIKEELDKNIATVLAHGRYIMGPEVLELEEALAQYVGAKHCVTVSSGTDSLLIALMALGVGPGDEVITIPYTWISTAEVIALLGAKPVFIDVCPQTWNMNPELLADAITDKTKAIMPVGIYGQMADMKAINEIAKDHGDLPVIEDAAQCFGATQGSAKSCNAALIGSTSFFPSKPLGCYGDGGALFTNDDEIATLMKQIRVHGQKQKHVHPVVGLNGRLDTLQAAILLPKLSIFDNEVKRRQEIAAKYQAAFNKVDGIDAPTVAEGNTSVWAQYTILSDDRDVLSAKLKDAGIPSVSYYAKPLHLQEVFVDLGYKEGDFPISESVAARCLSLPMSPYLTDEEVTQVTSELTKIYE
ncbi:DegT/DnrJ/EryC1/StrS family aminotransferase [Akkermansiaceae bacterium]|jgi:UDP-2-acetamido-2-deoxy-ribo-hexuluronate aminotransferase|nr:DegT/DnrJ/EryC1/StrS family aminotransferase [Akkermansiaceae bacterium]MDC0942983.1 DegT/DnrJ/EryC1/StrS family aminotransferase [Gammaproteobacteria bacterium]